MCNKMLSIFLQEIALLATWLSNPHSFTPLAIGSNPRIRNLMWHCQLFMKAINCRTRAGAEILNPYPGKRGYVQGMRISHALIGKGFNISAPETWCLFITLVGSRHSHIKFLILGLLLPLLQTCDRDGQSLLKMWILPRVTIWHTIRIRIKDFASSPPLH